MSETRKVPIEDILIDERCQARADVDHGAMEEYRQAYADGVALPPPEVFSVGGKLYLVDGYHRVPAALRAGVGFLRVEIVGSGTLDDAVWYATGVNQAHGVRRTNEDKRRAVRMALESPIGQEQSSRAIAEHCGVSPDFVARRRKEWEAEQVSFDDTSAPAKRKGRDGKEYPAQLRTVRTSDERGAEGPGETDRTTSSEPPQLDEPTAQPLPGYGGTLRELAAEVAKLRMRAGQAIPGELNAVRQRVDKALREAEGAIKTSVPIVCPGCEGQGCDACTNRGWTTRLSGAA